MGIYSIRDRAVSNFAARNPGRAVDPASFAVLLELIMQLIAAFQDCKKEPEDAVAMVSKPTWLQRRVLTLKVKRELGRRGWRNHGRDTVAALLQTGREIHVEEMRDAFDDME